MGKDRDLRIRLAKDRLKFERETRKRKRTGRVFSTVQIALFRTGQIRLASRFMGNDLCKTSFLAMLRIVRRCNRRRMAQVQP